MVTLDNVLAAQQLIAGRLHRTPLIGSATLSARIGAPLYYEAGELAEDRLVQAARRAHQDRGAEPGRARARPRSRPRPATTPRRWPGPPAAAGLPCTVVMPETAPAAKVAATRGYGATVVFEPSTLTVFERANALVAEHGYTFVPPFDDPAVVAGQGTVGLEILEDLPDVGTVVVPIGGGGLIAGVALALKSRRPDVRIVGVEPTGAAAMWRSRQQGQPVRLDKVATVADGLSAPFAGELPFALVQQYVDDLALVSDTDICAAMTLILERCKVLAEPGGRRPHRGAAERRRADQARRAGGGGGERRERGRGAAGGAAGRAGVSG